MIQHFELILTGTPVEGSKGVKMDLKLSGNPHEAGSYFGVYANEALKQKNDPTSFKIIVNAYHKLKEENQELLRKIERELGIDPGRIIKPYN